MSESGTQGLKCSKCGSTNIDLCPICRHGLKKCMDCGFVAEERYFRGEVLPSKHIYNRNT